MKIAVLVRTFPAISETFVLNQVIGLIEQGHQVDVFARRPPRSAVTHEDVRRHRLLDHSHYWAKPRLGDVTRELRNLGDLLRRPRRIPVEVLTRLRIVVRGLTSLERLDRVPEALYAHAHGDYDIIYCHFGHIGMRGDVLRELGGLRGKLVTVFHGYDMSTFLKERGDRVYDGLLERGDLFLPISDHWRQRLIGLGADPSKIVVHHMGVDLSRFAFAPRTRAPGEPTNVLQIARLVEKKGLRYGIEAVAKVTRERPGSITYNIVGDGPERPELEALVARLGVGDSVVFHGWKRQDEIVGFLDRAHLLLCPSVTAASGDMEGIPVALMEAMAQGLPVLTTRHSGIPELVEDGVSGYLVEERDAEALADRLVQLIDHPEQWPILGEAGRKRVVDEFDVDALNLRLTQLFRELLD